MFDIATLLWCLFALKIFIYACADLSMPAIKAVETRSGIFSRADETEEIGTGYRVNRPDLIPFLWIALVIIPLQGRLLEN